MSAAERLEAAHRELLQVRLESYGDEVDAATRDEVLRQLAQSPIPGLRDVFMGVVGRHERT